MESTLLSHFIILLWVHRYYRKLAQMFGIVSDERCRCSPFGRTLRADLQQKIKQCAVTRSAVILTFPHKKKTGAVIQTWNLRTVFKPSLRCIKSCLDQFLMTAWSRLSFIHERLSGHVLRLGLWNLRPDHDSLHFCGILFYTRQAENFFRCFAYLFTFPLFEFCVRRSDQVETYTLRRR